MKKEKSGKRKNPLVIVLIVLLVLFVLEMFFHFFEIAVGKLLVLTNSQRAQTGRMWEEEAKDINGEMALDSLSRVIATDSLVTRYYSSFYELHSDLMLQNRLVLGRKQFLNFYLSIPVSSAKSLIDPMKLLSLRYNSSWVHVEMVLNNNQLSMVFVNGYGDKLEESYININRMIGNDRTIGNTNSSLNNNTAFRDRILPAEAFYRAYLQLPVLQRLQIMNDPYKLLYWGDDLIRVGISASVISGTVEIAFEVMSDYKIQVHKVNASEMAVGYLIAAINRQPAGFNISTPR